MLALVGVKGAGYALQGVWTCVLSEPPWGVDTNLRPPWTNFRTPQYNFSPCSPPHLIPSSDVHNVDISTTIFDHPTPLFENAPTLGSGAQLRSQPRHHGLPSKRKNAIQSFRRMTNCIPAAVIPIKDDILERNSKPRPLGYWGTCLGLTPA